MKIVTFNIRCCDDKNGHSIDERAPRLKQILEKYNPDIIGFQEVTPRWMEYLNRYYSGRYSFFNKYRSHTNLEATPIFWKEEKFECIDKGYFWFSDTPWIESFGKDTYGCKRICMWVYLKEKCTNKEFFFFNTHFGFGDEEQMASVQLIKRTVDVLKAGNAIIVGDFNMEPKSKSYNEMIKNYIDVNAVTGNNGITFHNYGYGEEEHIDYCFTNNENIEIKSTCLIDDLVDGKYPSDHYGVLAELHINI